MPIAKKITSEREAWDLLKQLGTSTATPDLELVFEEFPKVAIKFEGPQFHSSLAVRHMEALRAIQGDIYRLYALAVYDDEGYTLSAEEKESVELFFVIKEGSAEAIVEGLTKALTAFAVKAAGRMEPKHYMILALIAAVGYAAPEIYEARMNAQTAVATAQATATAAQAAAHTEEVRQAQETERMRILTDAVRQVPKAAKVIETRKDTIEKIAKSVRGNEKVVLPDKTVVTEQVAKELFPRNKRRTAVQERLDGPYSVKGVIDYNGELKAKIVDIKGREHLADFSSLDTRLSAALYEALTEHKVIMLQVNAKNLEGEHRDFFIVGLQETTVVAESPTP